MTQHARARIGRMLTIVAVLFATVCVLARPPLGADYPVDDDTSLRSAITSVADGDTITFTGDITLSGDLPIVQRSITILGQHHTLDGGGLYRGFFIANFNGGSTLTAVNVTIQDVTITDARAQGGAGGAGGGGGAGLGSAIFVASQATVTASDVHLTSNSAVGGAGGGSCGTCDGGGGGGLGGNGGSDNGGGGGIGSGATGGTGRSLHGPGLPGIATGASPGGASSVNQGGSDGGGGAGESVLRFDPGGGGVGGGGSQEGFVTRHDGGFGGGGAAGDAGPGNGGFGGGGGASYDSGNGGSGGFGGGGGAGPNRNPGAGGFGGGDPLPGASEGAGGLGAGGAIFVQQGGTLTLAGSLTLNGNLVTGGASGGFAGPGSAFGSGIFVQGNDANHTGSGTLTFSPGPGETQTLSDTITDQTGAGGSGGNAGSWGILKSGAGTLVLGGTNAYSGATSVTDGTLWLTSGIGAAGATVGGGGHAATLQGDATIAGPVTVLSGGIVSPHGLADPVGLLPTGPVTFDSGGVLAIDLNGTTPSTAYDVLSVTGAATLTNATLAVTVGFTPTLGQTFTILESTQPIVGTFSGLPEGGTFVAGSYGFSVSYAGSGGTAVTLTNVLVAQTIAFAGDQTFSHAAFIGATASSGLALTLTSSTPAVCTTSGAAVAIVGVGRCTLTAAQAGSTAYSAIGPLTQSLSIVKADQTIAFAALSATTYGGGPFTVSPTASSGLGVTLQSTTPSVCTVTGSTVTIVGAGSCTINADQGGSANYNAAVQVPRSFTVARGSQTIAFGALGGRTLGDAPFAVSATTTSGLAVMLLSQTTSVCTLSGTTVTLVGIGTCTIAADQAGNGNYNAATEVTRSFAVAPNCANLAIAPAALGSGFVGIPFSQTLAQTGGATPATFALIGTLPDGVSFIDGVLAGTPSQRGAFPVTIGVTDGNGCQASFPYTLSVSRERFLAVGAGAGGASRTRTFNIDSAAVRSEASPFGSFTGGTSVALGDTTGGGVVDLVTGAGPGGGPAVSVIDGATGAVRLSFFAYDVTLHSGVEVASADVNGDGIADIITVPGSGSAPLVRIFDGRTGGLISQFFAMIPSWTYGLHVAAGDVNGDGTPEIIIGSGPNGPPLVQVFTPQGTLLSSFQAFTPDVLGGVYVAAGDVNGDGYADIVTGAGPGSAPIVRVFDGRSNTQIAGPLGSFLAYPSGFPGGVRVGAGDLTGDGHADVITGAGPGGGPHTRVFDGATGTELYGLFAFDPAFAGGVFVAGPPSVGRMNLDVVAGGGGQLRVAGWALRETSINSVGTDAIHAWAYPVGGGSPVFVAAAPGRVARPDVAAVFGGEFLMSGFDFTGPLAPGTYDLIVYARNDRTFAFDQVRVVRVTVQ